MLLVLNLPLVGLWVRLITVPYHLLYPAILVFSVIGVYTIAMKSVDVYFMALFGVLGYVFAKLECEPAPLLLAFILGPMMEENFRRAMQLAQGDATSFLTRPISATLLAIAAAALIASLLPAISKGRQTAFEE